MAVYRLEIEARPGIPDALAAATRARIVTHLGLEPAWVRTRRVYSLALDITAVEAEVVLHALVDPVAERGAVGALADEDDALCLTVGFCPGVTDSVGTSVARAAADRLERPLRGQVYTATMYRFGGLSRAELERVGGLLHNPLIERLRVEEAPHEPSLEVPRAGVDAAPTTQTIPLRALDEAALVQISEDGHLSLSAGEMRAVQAHFTALGRDPTDAELECVAQTWSEHCKHKIFASPIDYTGPGGHRVRIRRGLFHEHIRGLTEALAELRRVQETDEEDAPFLVSVFHDNAGVVRFTDADHLVYKVETHNSPSALDPYGGAMTGIVGVNRDCMGTGLGADLLANVWGYCLGPPDYDGRLPAGLMHPRRIREGVHAGVVDGGNQSGIPYARGWELFDERFVGKPLVFCGTVAAMPVKTAGQPTHVKRIAVGDVVVMVGGRIGKDGIHGATFSSVALSERSPVQAVQIGDPITQKMVDDFLREARARALYSGITDNGAGGLSSSVGEMAEATGGVRIDLAKAPLKYPGLAPWEILISEAQERMTVAVPPAKLAAFLELARRREVEATPLGEFTSTGRFEVTHDGAPVVDLALSFLHDGVPLPELEAVWEPPARALSDVNAVAAASREDELADALVELLRRPNTRSLDRWARRYDHEVKGLSVVKPLVGVRGDVPATATVMRARHGRDEGIVLAEGVHPYYGDVDAHAMATAAVDEGVRRALCAGARFDRLAALDNFCWPNPIVSPQNPDGRHKLAQLVRCCEGLREACEVYGVPLISGKDSMKNDAYLDGVKISIPPTLLVSVLGQTPDVRRVVGLAPLRAGDDLYVLGPTRDELGGSEFARARGLTLDTVPRTDVIAGVARYRAFVALRDAGRVRSAHVIGRGGLALALAHLVLASELGLSVDLAQLDAGLSTAALLYSETTGRVVFTARADDRDAVDAALAEHGLYRVGVVRRPRRERGWLRVHHDRRKLFELSSARMRSSFTGTKEVDDAL